jgi:hypothetical protein
MKENMQEEIILNVRTQMADGTYRRNSFKRNMVSAAACLMAIGMVSIPAYAGYQGFKSAITSDKVLARMQEIPNEEQQDIYNMVQYEQRSLHADQFSREYTEKEMSRRKVLQQEYENGRFPENTLAMVENAGQIQDYGELVYAKDTSYFYLPERELTDEEILQILDFNSTREYVLEQNPEVQRQKMEQYEEAIREKQGDGLLP